MARVRPLKTYPPEFWDMVRGAATGKEYTIVVDKFTQALSLQGKFYAFRQALSREAQSDPVADEVYTMSLSVICWIDKASWKAAGGGPVTVKFCNKMQHPDSVLLRSATVEDVGLPGAVMEKVESAFDRAMRLQKELEPKDPTGGKYG